MENEIRDLIVRIERSIKVDREYEEKSRANEDYEYAGFLQGRQFAWDGVLRNLVQILKDHGSPVE